MQQSARRGLSLVVAAIALIAGLVVLAPHSTAQAQALPGELPASCNYQSARLLGWLWADGSYNPDTERYFFRTRSVRVADHVEQNLQELGLTYFPGTSGLGHFTFAISTPGYDESFLTESPVDDPLVSCALPAFLASLIEGEGSVDGKIFDDDLLGRRTIVADLAADVGITTNFLRNQVRVRPFRWSAFESLPFVACGRVPGGTDHCVLGQVPSGPPAVEVLIYAKSNYNGTSASLDLGIHNAPALGELNNDVQSIRVPEGAQVTMCTHAGGLGSCKTLTADTARLEKTYINKVSYFRVEYIG